MDRFNYNSETKSFAVTSDHKRVLEKLLKDQIEKRKELDRKYRGDNSELALLKIALEESKIEEIKILIKEEDARIEYNLKRFKIAEEMDKIHQEQAKYKESIIKLES